MASLLGGIGLSCTYESGGPRKGKSKVSVGHRIQQLEELVRSLLAQQQSTPDVDPDGLIRELSSHAKSPKSVSTVPQTSLDENTLVPAIDRASISQGNDIHNPPAPSPSEPGSMRRNSHGVSASYVGSVHWAAVLDSISELKDRYEEEEEARMLDTNDHVLLQSSGPRLLYEPVHTTKADLLASIPPRPVVDRLVAKYFNTQGAVPSILHSGHFLQEYDKFWQNPPAMPCIWIGLLFSVMSVATLCQYSIDNPTDPEIHERVRLFREQTLHSLILGQYTKGGEYVLETLISYLICESFMSQDDETGLWLVQGIIVQLALSQGYHRDPNNFPSITPFSGEMRRRVWVVIVQLDLRLSSQMALPCVLKSQQYDTAEPRNLLDSDFDENTTDLPPSRPETEVTPVLYSLAKGRIDNMMGLVSDLVNDTKEHPYTEIMELDRKLQEAEASLPPIFQWQPLSQSFMVAPEIVMHRLLLQLAIQRLTIWLHRKYLAPPYTQTCYQHSRNACVQAAIRILEFQQIVLEETQADGLLYPAREAKRAIDYLSLRLGLQEQEIGEPLADSMADTPQDTNLSLDQFTWDTYDETDIFSECIAGFPITTFTGGLMGQGFDSATSDPRSGLFSMNLETPDSATG
ncbi:hypothetical protein FDENT_13853 [Fusarium denticulatum]|uniref:Xylanolytic transcriptional activator regulatory domain-containing protein n=1 Tax=Fusarium denticulatum TaxID=48507 RepID=A0A8H5STM7_9HYPO|nr:hypothetical protein FDENT_13853 [Fusarium denticulatum]